MATTESETVTEILTLPATETISNTSSGPINVEVMEKGPTGMVDTGTCPSSDWSIFLGLIILLLIFSCLFWWCRDWWFPCNTGCGYGNVYPVPLPQPINYNTYKSECNDRPENNYNQSYQSENNWAQNTENWSAENNNYNW